MSEVRLDKAAAAIRETRIDCNNLIADTIREQANDVATDVLSRGIPEWGVKGRAGLCSPREFSLAMFGEDCTPSEEQDPEQPKHDNTMTRLGISDEALRKAFDCEPPISDKVTGAPFNHRGDPFRFWYDKVTINAPLYRSQGSRAVALYMLTYNSDYQETLTGTLIIPVVSTTSNLYTSTPEYPDASYGLVDIFKVHRNYNLMRHYYSLRQSPDHHWGKYYDEPGPFSGRQTIGYQALIGMLGRGYQSNRTAVRNLLSSLDRIYDLADDPSNLEPDHWDPALTDYFRSAR